MFSKKLTDLMRVANVNNSALANAISIDPSYLSRLKTGKRKIPKNPSFLLPLSCYFSKTIKKDKKMMADFKKLITEDGFSFDEDNYFSHEIIYDWLIEGENVSVNTKSRMDTLNHNRETTDEINDDMFYYGNEGRQEAYLKFLDSIVDSDKITTVLLFSDENMDWFIDYEFSKRLVDTMIKIMEKGNHIKIIHSLERGLSELNDAIERWIPIYLFGKIDSYYYPKLKDHTMRRTLFIAPGISAITSNSFGEDSYGALTIFIKNKKAISTLADEFNKYINVCIPVFNKFNAEDKEVLYRAYSDTLKVDTDTISYNLFPSIFTMPESVKDSIEKLVPKEFDFLYRSINYSFINNMKSHKFTDIIFLTKGQKFNTDMSIPEIKVLFGEDVKYNKQSTKLHLEHMLNLLKTNDNYRLIIMEIDDMKKYGVVSKDLNKTAFLNLNKPNTVFISNEHRVSMALWDAINEKIRYFDRNYSREMFVDLLEKIIQSL